MCSNNLYNEPIEVSQQSNQQSQQQQQQQQMLGFGCQFLPNQSETAQIEANIVETFETVEVSSQQAGSESATAVFFQPEPIIVIQNDQSAQSSTNTSRFESNDSNFICDEVCGTEKIVDDLENFDQLLQELENLPIEKKIDDENSLHTQEDDIFDLSEASNIEELNEILTELVEFNSKYITTNTDTQSSATTSNPVTDVNVTTCNSTYQETQFNRQPSQPFIINNNPIFDPFDDILLQFNDPMMVF